MELLFKEDNNFEFIIFSFSFLDLRKTFNLLESRISDVTFLVYKKSGLLLFLDKNLLKTTPTELNKIFV